KLRLLLEVLTVQLVQLMDQVQLTPLLREGRVLISNIFDELVESGVFGVDAHALVKAGQKGGLPIRAAAGRGASVSKRNVARHIDSAPVLGPRYQRARERPGQKCERRVLPWLEIGARAGSRWRWLRRER